MRQSSELKAKQFGSDMLLASSLAAIRETCRTPIERYKVLVTLQPPPSETRSYVRHYYAKDGIGVYFRGLVGMLRRNVPPQALPLACNDLFNATLPAYEDVWKSSAVKLVSGGLAGAVTSVVHSPFQAAKRLAQAELHANGRSGNPKLGDLVNAAKSHGVTGLFAFAHVALVGAFIFRAGQLGGFKVLQEVNPYAKDTGLPGFFPRWQLSPRRALSSSRSTCPWSRLTGGSSITSARELSLANSSTSSFGMSAPKWGVVSLQIWWSSRTIGLNWRTAFEFEFDSESARNVFGLIDIARSKKSENARKKKKKKKKKHGNDVVRCRRHHSVAQCWQCQARLCVPELADFDARARHGVVGALLDLQQCDCALLAQRAGVDHCEEARRGVRLAGRVARTQSLADHELDKRVAVGD
jgi:hypothetical protein